MIDKKLHEIAELTYRIAELQEIKQACLNDVEQDVKGMTKREKIEAALNMPSLTPGHMDLLKEGFMTGSKVFGNPVTANDTDFAILCHPRAFTGYAIGAEFADYFESDGFWPLYANYKGELYNIICFCNEAQFDAWYMATQVMQHLRGYMVDKSPYHNHPDRVNLHLQFDEKWSRVRVFRALCDVLWPAEEAYYPDVSVEECLKYRKCFKCHREAINFMTQASKEEYELTGVCERCRVRKIE